MGSVKSLDSCAHSYFSSLRLPPFLLKIQAQGPPPFSSKEPSEGLLCLGQVGSSALRPNSPWSQHQEDFSQKIIGICWMCKMQQQQHPQNKQILKFQGKRLYLPKLYLLIRGSGC